MNLFKFILYSLITYLVIRFVMRIFAPPRSNQSPKSSTPKPRPDSLDKPKFTIEAESVDYEIIEESKDEK